MTISTDHLKHWLALWRIYDIGPSRFLKLLDAFPDIHEVFKAPTQQLSALGLTAEIIAAIKKPDWAAVEQNLKWAEQPHHHILTYNDDNYPPLLKQIAKPPIVLFVNGDASLLTSQQLAMVGSRNPTPNGTNNAQQFAQHLVEYGFTITSGLAMGIDAASHLGALSKDGKTIAVLGTGLEHIYPKSHQKLAQQIADQGALVSEYPLETRAKPENFPRRNRIICGLSLGVLVVEATLRSGSLITARFAAEQGREVFAIPGSIHNPLSRGCHYLIRQGAKLVESTQDILEEMNPELLKDLMHLTKTGDNKSKINAEEQALLEKIGFEATTIDQLVERTKQPIQVITELLFGLELAGLVYQVPGGYSR